MPVYSAQPTLNTSAYDTGDVLGGIQTLKGALAAEGLLTTITVIDVDNEGVQIDFVFFDVLPVGTYTNNAAAAINASDTGNVIGKASVLTGDYITIGTDKYGTTQSTNIQLPARTVGDLYVLAIVRGTPTFAATTDLVFKFGVLR